MLYQEGLKTLKKGLEKGVSKDDFIKTGFKRLDKKYGGIYRKGITVVAGAYQDELTNFGVSILKNLPINEKNSYYYISFHDIEIDVVKKVTSAFLKIKMKRIISGKLKKKDQSKIDKLIKSETILPIHILNNIKQDIVELTYMIKNLIFDRRPNLFILDGLSDIEGNQVEKMKLIESLKSISHNTGVPFLVLNELGAPNKPDSANGHPFQMDLNSDRFLKGMSDCIIYLANPLQDNAKARKGKSSKGPYEMVIRKSKYGKTGTVKLKYRTNYCLFEDFGD
jgi:replicative DNA helicase